MKGMAKNSPGKRLPVQDVFPDATFNDENEEEKPMWFGTRAFRYILASHL